MSSAPQPLRRLFFALWPSAELRHEIEHETRHVARHSGGRVIPARNFHVTLAFLGAVAEARIDAAKIAAATVQLQPFALIFGHVEWWERQELLCLEPTAGGDLLGDLVSRLHAALRAKEFSIEQRPFRAHLTLAREVRREHAVKPVKELCWPVSRIALVESQTSGRGSEYTVLAT